MVSSLSSTSYNHVSGQEYNLCRLFINQMEIVIDRPKKKE